MMQKPELLDYEPRKPNLGEDIAFLSTLFLIFGVIATVMWMVVGR